MGEKGSGYIGSYLTAEPIDDETRKWSGDIRG